VGAGPAQIALTRDGRTLLSANRDDDTAFITYEGDTAGMGGVVAVWVQTGQVLWAAEAGA